MEAVMEKLRQSLSRREKQYITDSSRVPSAVLLPIYCKQGEYHILFTKRTEKVKNHKGQISFPGGAYEEQDGTLVNTALRESTEEIGLKAEDVEILGELDDTATTTSSYTISPFVAAIPWPYRFKRDKHEAEEIIEVPISALLDKDNVHLETEFIDNEVVASFFYNYQGRVIWGATARILNQFLDIFTSAVINDQE